MVKAYVPYGEQKDVIYQEANKTPQPYSFTKTEYAATEDAGIQQITAITTITSNSTVSLYTVPAGYTLFITQSTIQTVPVGAGPAVPTNMFTRLSYGQPSNLFYINYMNQTADAVGCPTSFVAKISERNYIMPLRVTENTIVQASFTGGAGYWSTFYQITGYLQPNLPVKY